MKHLLTILTAMVLVTGCTHTVTLNTPIQIPHDKYICIDSDPRPHGETILESQVAKYIASLEHSNLDCKTRLEEIHKIIDCFNDKACKVESLGVVDPHPVG